MFKFRLDGRVIPKARPRVTRGRGYLPLPYREWKESAIASLKVQANEYAIASPLTGVRVVVALHGKMRGDADNCLGAILDALVQAGIILDDRLSCVPGLQIDFTPGKETYAEIELLPS